MIEIICIIFISDSKRVPRWGALTFESHENVKNYAIFDGITSPATNTTAAMRKQRKGMLCVSTYL